MHGTPAFAPACCPPTPAAVPFPALFTPLSGPPPAPTEPPAPLAPAAPFVADEAADEDAGEPDGGPLLPSAEAAAASLDVTVVELT